MIGREDIEEFERSGAWPADLPRAIICPPSPFCPESELDEFLHSLDRVSDNPDVRRARKEAKRYLKSDRS